MQKLFIHLCVLWLLGVSLACAGAPADYPIPPESERSLFYLQRSSNSNTIVYDANILPSGRLKADEPIDVYWMRYNTDGQRKSLSFVERKFAYGLSFDRLNDDSYTIRLTAYSDRDIAVTMDDKKEVSALMIIAGKRAQLKKIYLDISGSGFWTSVNYVELTGIDLKSGKLVNERFDPDEDDD